MKKHFEILDLEEGASQAEIKAAYNSLSKKLNPANNDNQDFFKEEYKKVQAAYKALYNTSILATEQGAENDSKGKVFKNSETKNEEESNKDSISIKNEQAFGNSSKQNLFSFNFKQYFFYNGSYISSSKYGTRKFLQWPLILLGVGFYLRGVTTYTRSRSLNLSVLGSVVFSIYSFVIDIYIIIIYPMNEYIGVVDDMLWVYIYPILPLTYLIFADGKKITKP